MAASRKQLWSLAALTLGTQTLGVLAGCRQDVGKPADAAAATKASAATPAEATPAEATPVAAAPSGDPSPAEVVDADAPNDAWKPFFDHGLAYCDAAVLAKAWGGSPEEAKTRAGTKIAGGDARILDEVLADARRAVKDPEAVCPFHQSEYSFDDVADLAALWEMDVAEAKARVERKLVWGDRDVIEEALREARTPRGAAERPNDEALRGRFWDAKYTTCDAEVIASHWKMDVLAAKSFAGQKLEWGNRPYLEDELRAAREALVAEREELCPFYRSDYAYADAEALAAVWKIDVEDAKARVTDKLFWGHDDQIKAALASAKRGG